MLISFKDPTLLYPVTDEVPLTFPVTEAGGVKETGLTVQTGAYSGASILQIRVVGADLYQQPVSFSLSIRLGEQSARSVLPNNTLLLPLPDSTASRLTFTAHAIVLAGEARDWRHVAIECQVLQGGAVLDYRLTPVRVLRAGSALPLRFRLLSEDRRLETEAPGFTWGRYRWRDDAATNAKVLLPTNWQVDTSGISENLWQAGMARGADLALDRLYRQDHSIYPIIQSGEYFTGRQRYYSPSKEAQSEIFPLVGPLRFPLAAAPARQKPIFVGVFQADATGFFDARVRYRYRSNGSWEASDPGPQFHWDRRALTITLNQGVPVSDLFLGFAPQTITGSVRLLLPIYPVWEVTHVYFDRPDQACPITSFSRETGVIELTLPAAAAGRRLYLSYVPAILVQYETAPEPADPEDPQAAQPGEQLLTGADLNPAFAGISQGVLYLLHRTPRVQQLVLSVDKPRLALPASRASILDLTAYGPVFYEQDFALLLVTALGANPNERIAGARLQVVPGADFQGRINSVNPITSPVTVVTGGDGVSTFVYRPLSPYGFYLDPGSVAAATITLPIPVSLASLWNAQDGWLLRTYTVGNDAPTLGKVGANAATGEIAWATNGVPGTPAFQTNGYRQLWKSAGQPVQPTQLIDAGGHAAFLGGGALNPAFNGQAVSLVYGSSLPMATNIGAYFIAFTGLATLQVKDLDTGILSNSILLQLAPSGEVIDAPAVQGYLYTSSGSPAKSGRLNANRLGGGPLPSVPFYTPLVS